MTDYATRLVDSADTAQRMRLSDAVHAAPNGLLRSRGGLRADGGGVPALVPSSLKFTLTPFLAEVPGASDTQGAYPFVHDDATTQYTILPGDPLGARVDLAVARVRHDAHDSSGFTDAGIVVLKGNPATGVAPAVPAGCIPLREFNVSASASAGAGGVTIGADRRRWVAAATDVQAARSAVFTVPPTPTKTVVVVFPRPFTDPPVVTHSLAAANVDVLRTTLGAVTATQATFLVYNSHPTFTATGCVINVIATPAT